jgi:hypothetical protein
MVKADVVRACYRVLLNRESENETVVRQTIGLPNLEALLLHFVNSPEYKAKIAAPVLGPSLIQFMKTRIAPLIMPFRPEQLAACSARIRREWTVLGE